MTNRHWLFLCVFSFIGIWILFLASDYRVSHRNFIPTGDEPHYLLITHSLVYDHDINLANNYQNQDWKIFYNEKSLEPHNFDKTPYSVHNFGLPLILTVPYAMGGYPAVLVFISLVMLSSLILCWRTAGMLAGTNMTNIFPLWAIGLSTPWLSFAGQVYTEVIAMFLVSYFLYVLIKGPTRLSMIAVLLGLAYLPLLHLKFSFLIGVFGVLFFFRCKGWMWKGILSGWVGLIVLEMCLLGWMVYGKFSIFGPYAGYNWSSYRRLGQTWLIYLLDPQYGFLFQSPVYLVSILGGYLVWKDHRWGWMLPCVFLAYYGFLSYEPPFFIGWTTAGRFLLPVMPVLAILTIRVFQEKLPRMGQIVVYGLGGLSLLFALFLNRHPAARYLWLQDYANRYVPGAKKYLPHYWEHWEWGWDGKVPMPSLHTREYIATAILLLFASTMVWLMYRAYFEMKSNAEQKN